MRDLSGLKQHVMGQTVIAHISDLHFQPDTKFEEAKLQALISCLKNEVKPDLLVVTGDLIDYSIQHFRAPDVRRALQNSRKFLELLCSKLGLQPNKSMFIIPGNHDYRLVGNFRTQASRERFDEQFKDFMGVGVLPDLKTILFTFDSNTEDDSMNFACGRVDEKSFIELDDTVKTLAQQTSYRWFDCTKIALVHHHPMPIPPSENSSRTTDREEFLHFRNAGTFMQQMAKAEIEIILHGHKHYPSYSRVVLPPSKRSVAVIGAGSVMAPPKEFYCSFNSLILEDGGTQTLHRWDKNGPSYVCNNVIPIRSYEEARAIRFEDLAKKENVSVRASKYVRCDVIQDGSGDVLMYEEFHHARAFTKTQVVELPHVLKSESGVFGDRKYSAEQKDQGIEWEWTEKTAGGKERKAKTIFTPPLKHDKFITFYRSGTIWNAIHFSKQDRLGATHEKSDTENMSIVVKQAYESLCYQLRVPKRQWPQQFHLSVLIGTETNEKTNLTNDKAIEIDEKEREYCASFLTQIEQSRSVILTIDRPLVGRIYKIWWDLPEHNCEDLLLSDGDSRMANELRDRLLIARQDSSETTSRLVATFDSLAEHVIHVIKVARSAKWDPKDLEIIIWCYDVKKRGLVCIAAHNYPGPPEELWSTVIMPGCRIEGQAYRRRESMIYGGGSGRKSTVSPYYELPTTPQKPHKVLCCIPIFYPLAVGMPIAVVSIGARSNTSGLSKLLDERRLDATMVKLVEQVVSWFKDEVFSAVGFLDEQLMSQGMLQMVRILKVSKLDSQVTSFKLDLSKFEALPDRSNTGSAVKPIKTSRRS